MNIITSMLFLQDFLSAPHAIDDRGRAFAQGYGNRIASRQAFPSFGHEPAGESGATTADDLRPVAAGA
jgi:hypothetical protein